MHTPHQATGRPAHHPAPPPRVGGLGPDLTSLADIVDRLFAEFESRLGVSIIVATIRRCHRELDTIHGDSLPELLERLARQRLHAIISTRPNEQARRPP